MYTILLFFKILFIFREKGREGKKRWREISCVVASHMPPTGHPACNPGMCPDWESNLGTFGSYACMQSTEPHQPEPCTLFLRINLALRMP